MRRNIKSFANEYTSIFVLKTSTTIAQNFVKIESYFYVLLTERLYLICVFISYDLCMCRITLVFYALLTFYGREFPCSCVGICQSR